MKSRLLKTTMLVSVLALLPSAGYAADPPKGGTDPAAAQTLFYDARALMKDGRFAEACAKLEESLRLDSGIGTLFNLSDCNEHIGKTATAWAGFLEVAAQAKVANQAEREKVARKRAQALEPRLPKLVVEVPVGTASGLTVKRDGVVIGAPAWGTAIPVDPGSHRVSASAPGKQTWETSVQANEGKTARVTVPRDLPSAPVVAAVPATNGAANAAASNANANNASATSPTDFPPPVVSDPGSTQRTVGWLITGLGAVGVGVGAGFGLASLGKRNDAREHCAGDACDPEGVSLRDDAIQSGNISTIATIAGGVAVAGGLVLVLTAPKRNSESRDHAVTRVRAVPSVAQGGGGLLVQGVFQ